MPKTKTPPAPRAGAIRQAKRLREKTEALPKFQRGTYLNDAFADAADRRYDRALRRAVRLTMGDAGLAALGRFWPRHIVVNRNIPVGV